MDPIRLTTVQRCAQAREPWHSRANPYIRLHCLHKRARAQYMQDVVSSVQCRTERFGQLGDGITAVSLAFLVSALAGRRCVKVR